MSVLAASSLALCERRSAQVLPVAPVTGPSPGMGPSGTASACVTSEVAARLRSFSRAVTAGDGTAVAGHFLAGPDLRWEVYEHFDEPNGTEGALRSPSAIAAFVREVHAAGEVWTYVGVAAPDGTAGGPRLSTYGWQLTIGSEGELRPGGAKVVVDCGTGLISHMVGPGSA